MCHVLRDSLTVPGCDLGVHSLVLSPLRIAYALALLQYMWFSA